MGDNVTAVPGKVCGAGGPHHRGGERYRLRPLPSAWRPKAPLWPWSIVTRTAPLLPRRRSGSAAEAPDGRTCDVSSSSDVNALARLSSRRTGPVDVSPTWQGLPNGGSEGNLDVDDARWTLVLSVNLGGPFYLCRAIVPGMAERRKGAVVNVSSQSGRSNCHGWHRLIEQGRPARADSPPRVRLRPAWRAE